MAVPSPVERTRCRHSTAGSSQLHPTRAESGCRSDCCLHSAAQHSRQTPRQEQCFHADQQLTIAVLFMGWCSTEVSRPAVAAEAHAKQLQGCLHSDLNLSGPSPSRVQTARWTSSFVAGFLRPCVVDVWLWYLPAGTGTGRKHCGLTPATGL